MVTPGTGSRGMKKENIMNMLKAMGCSFGTAIVASFAVLLIGALLLGFNVAEWTEGEGRTIGAVSAVAGVVGAVAGLKLAFITERRTVND
jgi:hypothetical protein